MRLTTKRLILRNYKKSDAKSLAENINDKTIWYFTARIPYPYTLKMAKDYIKKQLKKKKEKVKTEYVFAIELKDKKGVIGAVGLHHIDKLHKNAEIGYWLGKNYRKQGIISESVKAVIDFTFKKLRLNKLWGKSMVENEASNALFKKFGFRRVGILKEELIKKGRKKDAYYWELLRKDYKIQNLTTGNYLNKVK